MDEVVLITGASSGIGEALAREYVRRGARVALLARRGDKLAALCDELNAHGSVGGGTRAIALTADVTRIDDLDAAVRRALDEFGGINVVIANAGGGVLGNFKRLTDEDYRAQFELNVMGVVHTLRAALAALERSGGSFAVVSSVMAYLAMPDASPYSVSKAAARSLAESLRVDLAPLGVSVTHVAPGFINTELRRVDAEGKRDPNGKDPVPDWLQMPAPVAARKIVGAIRCRRRELVLTGVGKLGVFFAMHFPGFTAWVLRAGALSRGRRRTS